MPWLRLPYLCVLTLLVLAGFGLPIPEDIPLLMGGYLCYQGLASWPLMVVVGLIGVLIGDTVLYSLGRLFGHHIFEHRLIRRIVKPSRLLLAEELFARHGLKLVFGGRFMPGLRSVVFVASGVLKVPAWQFLAVDGSAALVSVPAFVLLGKFFGYKFDQLRGNVHTIALVVGAVIITLAALGIWQFWRRFERELLAKEQLSCEANASARPGDSQESPADSPHEPLAPEPEVSSEPQDLQLVGSADESTDPTERSHT